MKTFSKRFTLIELLIVIAIIGILAGLVFPALGTVRNNAKRSKASTECQSLKTAIIMYESEFSCWPVKVSGTKDKDAAVSSSEYVQMCRVLTGENSKKMVFYEVGVGYDEDKGILDPWGRPYQVILDIDFDGKIDNDVKDNNNKTVVQYVGKYYGKNEKQDLRTKVAVYSFGVEEWDKIANDPEKLAAKKKLVISW